MVPFPVPNDLIAWGEGWVEELLDYTAMAAGEEYRTDKT